MKMFLFLLLDTAVFVIIIRWLYHAFIMPATLSQYTWYDEYMELLSHIRKADSRVALQTGLEGYYRFTRSAAQNKHQRYCSQKLVRALEKKRRIYKYPTAQIA